MLKGSQPSIPKEILVKIAKERREERNLGFTKAIEVAKEERGYRKLYFTVRLKEAKNSFEEHLKGLGIDPSKETEEFIDGFIEGCSEILKRSAEAEITEVNSEGEVEVEPSLQEMMKQMRKAGLFTERASTY
jgi:arginyl-tRNA synthetase